MHCTFARLNAIQASLALVCALMIITDVQAKSSFKNAQVDALLAKDEAPQGVVFELISGDPKTWVWASPMLADFHERLRAKFAGLDIVVVSHGAEQFQLMTSRKREQPAAIAQLADLASEGVDVHVCGVHSSWRDVPQSAYLNFIDVTASGPAQINDYVALGYAFIILDRPDD